MIQFPINNNIQTFCIQCLIYIILLFHSRCNLHLSSFFHYRFLASLLPVSSVQQRVYTKDDSKSNINRDGETITITPSKTIDIFCSDTRYNKRWYRVSGQNESSITKLSQTTNVPDVYAINTEARGKLTLQLRPFQSTHAGEYECRFTRDGRTLTPLSVFLSKLGLHRNYSSLAI